MNLLVVHVNFGKPYVYMQLGTDSMLVTSSTSSDYILGVSECCVYARMYSINESSAEAYWETD